jgi:hypothetical protein
MSVPLLFLPLQAVRASLRLAICAWIEAGMNCSGRQSQSCASLLAWIFRSVLPCLRGESASAPITVALYHVGSPDIFSAFACFVYFVVDVFVLVSLPTGDI